MAHGDYNCCALCDCKMEYSSDPTTKEAICSSCLRCLHKRGVMVYTGAELESWIKASPQQAREILPGIGYSRCFYPNPVDEAFNGVLAQEPTPTNNDNQAQPAGATGDEVVGHMTLSDGRGGFSHEPLRRREADEIMRHVEAETARRNSLMPDEHAAIHLFFDAWLRLKDFGWREAIYCPKDGSMFKAIEPGSTGIFDCAYEGEWPKGSWWLYVDNDTYPSRPALFKPNGETK